eukprot:8694726-Pyramimonas_sp.AAC.1
MTCSDVGRPTKWSGRAAPAAPAGQRAKSKPKPRASGSKTALGPKMVRIMADNAHEIEPAGDSGRLQCN